MQQFKFHDTKIKGLFLIEPFLSEDARGYFLKSFEIGVFKEHGIEINMSEINESRSTKGVVRGLHFQKQCPQSKLIRVERGEVFDAVVDLREGSATYGQWDGYVLSEENRRMLYIPKGFAHGFLTLSEIAVTTYVCDGRYVKEDEGGIRWDDETVGIRWPLDRVGQILLSEKDKGHGSFKEFAESGEKINIQAV